MEKKPLIVAEFEKSVSKDKEYWKTIVEISKITGSTETHVEKYITKSGDFVKNSKNKFTTRNIYQKRTPFADRLINAMINKIR